MSIETQWEYKTILCPSVSSAEISLAVATQRAGHNNVGKLVENWKQMIDDELNTLGSQGWELVAVWKSQLGSAGVCEWMAFKRLVRS